MALRKPEGQEVFNKWANTYVEHDPELAMEHFDKARFISMPTVMGGEISPVGRTSLW